MSHAVFTGLPSLADTLANFCREGRSGSLRIVTNDNHTAFFGLIAGQIVAVRYRIRKGGRAIEQMLGVKSGSYTFSEGEAVEAQGELPSTAEILALLGAANPDLPPPNSTAKEPVLEPAMRLPASVQSVLEDVLVTYAGPAASLMARGVFQSSSDVNAAIEKLAGKLPDSSQAQAFTAEAKSKLSHLI